MPTQNLLAVGSSFFEPGPWRLVHWYLAALIAAAAFWVRFGGQHRHLWVDRDLAQWMRRWFTGATLEQPGDDDEPQAVAVYRRPLVAVARTTLPAAAVTAEYVRSGSPHGGGVMLVPVAVAGTAALAAVTLAVVHVACRAAHYRQWVLPLHAAVYPHTGWGEKKLPNGKIRRRKPWRYLKVGRDFAAYDGGIWRKVAARFPALKRFGIGRGGVIVKVAPHFNHAAAKTGEGRPRELVEDNTRKTLSLSDVEATWNATGRHNYLQLRPKTPMRSVFLYTDPEVEKIIARLKPSEVLMGMGRGDKPVIVDLDSDAPHLLLSTGTGGGKSWTLHMLAAQLMAKGAEVVVIDFKRISHRWIRYLDGIEYALSEREIHDTIIQVAQEARRRTRLWDGVDLDDVDPRFPRLVLLVEEMNATMIQLKEWWRANREPSDPKISPALTAFRELLYMGRAVRVHLFAVAQMAIANDLGGPAARENFRVRIMAGDYSKNNWNMLVPQIDFVPGKAHQGWAMVCQGTTAAETQLLKMTPHEARELVMGEAGYQLAPRDDVAVSGDLVPLGAEARHVAVPRQLEQGVRPVSLWQASNDKGRGIVAMRYDALRKAADRDRKDGKFPQPLAFRGETPLYDPADLQCWHHRRSVGRNTAQRIIDVHEVTTNDSRAVVGTEGPERTRVGTT